MTAFSTKTLHAVFSFLALLAATRESSAVSPAMERIPVLAWGGPPADQTTPERYRELAEAGFTHNFSSFSNAAAMAAALDVAHRAGIKQLVGIPELEKDPEGTAQRFKEHPALAGYYLRDEPAAGDFPALARWMKRIQAVDPVHPCYINLFPNYANAAQLGAPSYQEHLDRFLAEVPVPIVSFDHYPVIGENLRAEWFENLEQIARAAAAAKKPFWAFALAVAHGPYPVATVEHLRLQVFSDLAYGAQGIQYFTYWTSKSDTWNFHEGPIDTDGRKTIVYDRVNQVNEEIRGLSRVFLGARVVRLGHTGSLPKGTRAYEPAPPIVRVQAEGGAIVSLLEKADRRFLAIVNRDLRAALSLVVILDDSKQVAQVGKDGSTQGVTGNEFATSVSPGDIVVLEWAHRQ